MTYEKTGRGAFRALLNPIKLLKFIKLYYSKSTEVTQ